MRWQGLGFGQPAARTTIAVAFVCALSLLLFTLAVLPPTTPPQTDPNLVGKLTSTQNNNNDNSGWTKIKSNEWMHDTPSTAVPNAIVSVAQALEEIRSDLVLILEADSTQPSNELGDTLSSMVTRIKNANVMLEMQEREANAQRALLSPSPSCTASVSTSGSTSSSPSTTTSISPTISSSPQISFATLHTEQQAQQQHATETGCVGWRQTGACSPTGPREAAKDVGCDDVVVSFASGYCDCGNPTSDATTHGYGCHHKPLTCANECHKPRQGERCDIDEYNPTEDSKSPARIALERGIARASGLSVFITGLVGQKGVTMELLKRMLERMERFAGAFASHRFVVVYNGPHPELTAWAQADSARRTLVEGAPSFEFPPGNFRDVYGARRYQTMASLRNQYLQHLGNEDLMLVVDMDLVWWDMLGVFVSLGQQEQSTWGAMCGYGRDGFIVYDKIAVRVSNHSWQGEEQHDSIRCEGNALGKESEVQNCKIELATFLETYPSWFVPVDSCFGGLALYNSTFVKNCKYRGTMDEAPTHMDCEHVAFHNCILNQSSDSGVFVNKYMGAFRATDEEYKLQMGCAHKPKDWDPTLLAL